MTTIHKKPLRELWDGREPTLGGWCSIPNSFTAEIMASCFDWCCIDMQHGLAGQDSMISMLQSLAITGTPAFVRVPWNHPGDIMRALDGGAQGVIVPMVNSAEEARKAVGAARYPPKGYRSWGPTRHALYDPDVGAHSINASVVCVIMIETIQAIDRIGEILDVEGIDAVFVGPSDLAVSLGLHPARAHENPEHRRYIDRVLDACRGRGIVAGIFCGGVENTEKWREAGFEMLVVQSDARILRGAAESMVGALRASAPAKDGRTSESAGYV